MVLDRLATDGDHMSVSAITTLLPVASQEVTIDKKPASA